MHASILACSGLNSEVLRARLRQARAQVRCAGLHPPRLGAAFELRQLRRCHRKLATARAIVVS
eukprot:3866063-Alexandrium_andersonii.AAC.1